jgi:hypothetical protein
MKDVARSIVEKLPLVTKDPHLAKHASGPSGSRPQW